MGYHPNPRWDKSYAKMGRYGDEGGGVEEPENSNQEVNFEIEGREGLVIERDGKKQSLTTDQHR